MEKLKIWPWNRAAGLSHLPVRAREDLWFMAQKQSHGTARGCFYTLLGIIFAPVGAFGALLLVIQVEVIAMIPIALLVGFFTPIAVLISIHWRQTHTNLRHILENIHRDTRLPCCFHCGYDFKGLPDNLQACPECGTTTMVPKKENAAD